MLITQNLNRPRLIISYHPIQLSMLYVQLPNNCRKKSIFVILLHTKNRQINFSIKFYLYTMQLSYADTNLVTDTSFLPYTIFFFISIRIASNLIWYHIQLYFIIFSPHFIFIALHTFDAVIYAHCIDLDFPQASQYCTH